jgi:predicted GIY-YIG superfamily endonuclease
LVRVRKKVARHHVYVIQLDPAVLEHAKFRAANPSHDPRKPPLYVGMTGLDPETRFERHKYGVKDNHYVRRYGVRLRPDLYAELNPLPYAEAQRMEWVLARELRSDGYAVWQK